MTTKADKKLCNKTYAFYNPENKSINDLPIIYGFNNGPCGPWGELYRGILLAEDGAGLGSHICSHEEYIPLDLGILEGTCKDRHEVFKKHYPHGYRMDFVSKDNVPNHKKLRVAYELNQEKGSKLP
jgi:hypothetical protein